MLFARRARFRDGTRRAVRKAITAARRIGLCSWEAQSEAWPRVGRFGDGRVEAKVDGERSDEIGNERELYYDSIFACGENFIREAGRKGAREECSPRLHGAVLKVLA